MSGGEWARPLPLQLLLAHDGQDSVLDEGRREGGRREDESLLC